MLARLGAPEALFGLALAGLGVFVLVAGEAIVSPEPWGPALMPRIVGAGLVLLGVATLVERMRAPVAVPAGEAENDWSGFALVLAAVVVFGVLVEAAGFPLAAALMFALVARGMDSRAPVRDFLIGLALAVGTYAVFALVLGLPLTFGGALESALRRL
jgi:putative tricarboxylic transport membrane protein